MSHAVRVCVYRLRADSIELYQKEEGCVPATFQMIFMVSQSQRVSDP